MVLRDLGDLAGARAAFERALRIFEKFLPAEHPKIATMRETCKAPWRNRSDPPRAGRFPASHREEEITVNPAATASDRTSTLPAIPAPSRPGAGARIPTVAWTGRPIG